MFRLDLLVLRTGFLFPAGVCVDDDLDEDFEDRWLIEGEPDEDPEDEDPFFFWENPKEAPNAGYAIAAELT